MDFLLVFFKSFSLYCVVILYGGGLLVFNLLRLGFLDVLDRFFGNLVYLLNLLGHVSLDKVGLGEHSQANRSLVDKVLCVGLEISQTNHR